MTERLSLLREWLQTTLDMQGYTLEPASEDASFRRYFRLRHNARTHIVMDAPPDKEDCRPFIGVAERLLACGVNVPEVLARDLDRGFLLLSDLGTQLYSQVIGEDNADSLYADAITALLRIQRQASVDGLPDYDEALLMAEMELFREWLLGRHLGLELDEAQQRLLDASFELLKQSALEQPRIFVHRDYHSRNLLYCPQGNPGIIDFQDAVYGPLSYDLVSLLKDCYIKWPRARIEAWVLDYLRQARERLGLDVDEARFLRWFDLMGAQRQLKASGIFARLYRRDGKPEYLKDIPRTLSYIVDMEADYPELGGLITLIREQLLPALAQTPGQIPGLSPEQSPEQSRG